MGTIHPETVNEGDSFVGMGTHGSFGNNSSYLIPFKHEPHILDNTYVQATLILLYTITFLLCFAGNLAIVLVVCVKWKIRSATKFCLGNLAIADLAVGLFCILQNLMTYLLDGWRFGEFMCKMYHFVNSLCHTASILILVVIAIERYMALVHPFMSRRLLTTTGLVLTIVAVWLLSAVISSPRLFYFGLVQIAISEGNTGRICVPRRSMYNSAIADTTYFVVLYVIPLGIITILYARIALYLRKSEWMRNNIHRLTSVEFHGRRSQGRPVNNSVNVEQEELHGEIRSRLSGRTTSKSAPGTGTHSGSQVAKKRVDYWDRLQHSGSVECKSKKQLLVLLLSPPKRQLSKQAFSNEKPSAFSDSFVYARSKKSLEILRDAVTSMNDAGGPFCGDSLGIQSQLGRSCRQFHVRVDRSSVYDFRVRSKTANTEQGESSAAPNYLLNYPSTRVILRAQSQRLLYHYNMLKLRNFRCRQRKRVVRVLISIVIAFAVLNLPYHVRKLCIHYLPSYDIASDTSTLIAPLTFLLMYANSAVNPILYAFMNNHFRKSLKDLWRKCCSRRV